MTQPPLYRIRDWDTAFDSGEARKLKNLNWVQMPNNHEGLAFRRLSRRDDCFMLFGAWCLLIQISSKNPLRERGYLSTRGRALTAEDLFVKTGFPEEGFDAALKYFSDPRVGWLEIVPAVGHRQKSPGTSGESPGTSGESPGTSGESPGTSGESPGTGHDMTGHDMTGEERKIPAHPGGYSQDAISRETSRLPDILDFPAFIAAWEKWLGYLSRQPGRKDFLTIDAHLKKLTDIAKRRGVPAAIDAIEYAISDRRNQPVEDTRPAELRAKSASFAGAGDSTPSTPESEAADREANLDHYLPRNDWKPPVLPVALPPKTPAAPSA